MTRVARPTAVVVGLDSATGLQTARILAARRIPVIGLAEDPKHFACRTRAVTRVVAMDSGDEVGLADVLTSLVTEHGTPLVALPCSDQAVLALAHQRERLAAGVRTVLPPTELVDTLTDKVTFASWARDRGLPVPRSVMVSSVEDLDALPSLCFPVVVKPPVKTPVWTTATRAKVFEAGDARQLRAVVERASRWTERLLVQEKIEGLESDQFTCNVHVGPRGDLLVAFTSRKLRQWPVGTGTGCLAVDWRDDQLVELARDLFSRDGYRGLGYVEVKRDARTGQYLIVEVNVGRPTGRSAMAELAGVELLLTAYRDALQLPPLPLRRRTQGDRRARWVYLRRDIPAAASAWRAGELGLGAWARSVAGAHDAVFSVTDPAPFLADVGRTVRRAGAATRRSSAGRPASRPHVAA